MITLPLVNRGTFKIFRLTPIPVALGSKRFLYIDTAESILCLDQARQYYFMLTEEEFGLCKTMDFSSYICKQKHPLMSSHLRESCAVKLIQARQGIPKSCETRVVELTNTVWVQLMNNQWIYFAPGMDSVTILCNDKEPIDVVLKGVGKLSIDSGCKGYSTSAVLQTSTTVPSNSSLKGGDLLTQIPLKFDCCEEMSIKLNVSHVPLDIKSKQLVSHLDDLRYASFKVSELEKEIREQEWKNRHTISHVSYSVAVYIILLIIVMYVLYKLRTCIRHRWRRTSLPKALPAPVREITPLADSSGLGNTASRTIKTSKESLAARPEAIPLHESTQSLEEETPTGRSLRPRTAKSFF